MGDFMATFIVAVILLWSAYVLLRRFMPKTTVNVQQAIADQATRRGWSKLGQWLTPKVNQSSCGGCSNCGDKPVSGCHSAGTTLEKDAATEEKVQPVQWR